ncbi:protein tyrosine kinase domain containing protein [Entamoeba histolytica HM-1:IMSS-B]|uniref:Protein kinase domain containing protein n=6 Tax=Entamoeba histolytica TaxID=5759 RepID=C4LU62_ENTH1|nr:protein kinase domain containing protein [Entamoeba histolytica HM-1:IMSS]EMD46687.1 protein tyrosine kinase domain containing protein [Entamoeba histolytica KU27]EMH73288.1 protein tyrosine kinase domain containing protein [Entamoeba histolytica HM-1:IMSS-B]EMS11877.1 protein tyrosine kinase domain containing protein [Entamoeba histolytica HM-3:IMSS]ENY60298.1 protein tyrosine kinase domain containing protein [Entamoeba histolytica HM-1:IMSS-A]GAT92133.1 protein kinase domain containing pr|eukprot:XP_650502.1 protein kinase domain containing protein [Entamoeba histolytica HM-1:IMSS]
MFQIIFISFIGYPLLVLSQTCSGTGCVKCIANETCSSCKDLYDPTDNSCSTCISVNPYQAITPTNRLVVLENGICTDKTSQVRKDFSDMQTITPNNQPITLHFSTSTQYSTGPCSFPLNKQIQYRGSYWIKIDLSSKQSSGSHGVFSFTTPSDGPVVAFDLTSDTPTTTDKKCYARQEIQPGGGKLIVPLPKTEYYAFVSIEDLTTFDITISLGFTDDYINNQLELTQQDISQLHNSNLFILKTFTISSSGVYVNPVCAPTKLMKGAFFTVDFEGSYSLLIDTTTQNRYCYLMEYTTATDSTQSCVDFWVGDWWGIWSTSAYLEQGLRVRINGEGSKKRYFFLGTNDHSIDIEVRFSTICPNHCYESQGNGKCSVKSGECVCNDQYGADDCRKLCYYNGKFYNGNTTVNGDDMCYFGSVGCDYDCKCKESSLEDHYCVSSACKNKDFNDASVMCIYNTSNCLPNCVCDKGYVVTSDHRCKIMTCGNLILNEGEECDGGTNCDDYCQCVEGYEIDTVNIGSCRSKPIGWWVWLLIALGIVFIFICSIVIIFLLIRFTKGHKIDLNVFKTQQPSYHYDITRSVPSEPSESSRYSIDPLSLDYGNVNVPTAVFDTRYEDIEIKNYSKNKYMMVIVHTPNNPKYVFHFDTQVTILRPRQSTTITSYMTLHCTTKIMGMKIPYTVWFSKHSKTLSRIASLLKDKTFEVWTDEDKEELERLMKDVPRKYRYCFEIKTAAASSTHIDMDELHLREQPIAEGASGTVYVGKYKSITVAVKKFRWENLSANDRDILKKDVIHECELMSKLRNPYIANYMGSVTYIPQISMVIQYFQLGSLGNYIRHEKPEDVVLPYKLKMRMLLDCAKGMVFLHENKIVHLDLKPDNLLVNSLYAESSSCVVKITDFGTSRIIKKNNSCDNENKGLGTPLYLSPEAYDDVYSFEGDVFSFAVMAWELFYATEPYKECKSLFEIKDFVKSGKRLPFDDTIPICLKTLIEECWKQKPDERPKFGDICKDMYKIVGDAPNHPEFDVNVSMERIEEIINEKAARVNELLADQDTD